MSKNYLYTLSLFCTCIQPIYHQHQFQSEKSPPLWRIEKKETSQFLLYHIFLNQLTVDQWNPFACEACRKNIPRKAYYAILQPILRIPFFLSEK